MSDSGFYGLIFNLAIIALSIHVFLILIGNYFYNEKHLLICAEILSIGAAIIGGAAIFNILSDGQESTNMASYRFVLNSVYNSSLYCHSLPPSYTSPAMLESCATVDAAYRDSFGPRINNSIGYWVFGLNVVKDKLHNIVQRGELGKIGIYPGDAHTIDLAIKNINTEFIHEEISQPLNWIDKFFCALIAVYIAIFAASIKVYVAIKRVFPRWGSFLRKN